MPSVDHVGYLVRDLDDGVAFFERTLGLAVTRRFERPEFGLVGAYLGDVEVFTFTDAELLDERLGRDRDLVLDHVAYAVDDIDAAAAALRAAGAAFCGPDLRAAAEQPFELGGVRHLWTRPESTGGVCLQLMQHPA